MQRAAWDGVSTPLQFGAWLWVIVPVIALIVAATVEVGYRLGRWVRARHGDEPDELTADLTTAALGLLGLMLAFTFGWTATRFDGRRESRIEEAQAIATLYHLADVLPPAEAPRLRALLDRYMVATQQPLEEAGTSGTGLRREIWQTAVTFATEHASSQIADIVLVAGLRVLDAHLSRSILATSSWIPSGISAGLFGVMICAMGLVGYRYGERGSRRSPALVFVVVALALVVYLIADLNRAIGGAIQLSTQPMRQTQYELRAWSQGQ